MEKLPPKKTFAGEVQSQKKIRKIKKGKNQGKAKREESPQESLEEKQRIPQWDD